MYITVYMCILVIYINQSLHHVPPHRLAGKVHAQRAQDCLNSAPPPGAESHVCSWRKSHKIWISFTYIIYDMYVCNHVSILYLYVLFCLGDAGTAKYQLIFSDEWREASFHDYCQYDCIYLLVLERTKWIPKGVLVLFFQYLDLLIGICIYSYSIITLATPWKLTRNLKKGPWEKDKHLQTISNHQYLGSMLVFRGVYLLVSTNSTKLQKSPSASPSS